MKKVAVILSVLMLALLASCGGKILGNTNYYYDNSSVYKEYTEEVKLNEFDTLDVDWLNGEVVIKKSDSFSIKEEIINKEYKPLYYYSSDNILSIKYFKEGTYKSNEIPNKRLILSVPANMDKIKLDLISANYSISLDRIEDLTIDSTSGKGSLDIKTINFLNIDSTSLDSTIYSEFINKAVIDSTSGKNIIETTNLTAFDFSSTSGNLDLKIKQSPDIDKINVDTISGDTTIILDGKRGYNLDFSSVSGKKNLEFDGNVDFTKSFKIIFSSTSGDLKIIKGDGLYAITLIFIYKNYLLLKLKRELKHK